MTALLHFLWVLRAGCSAAWRGAVAATGPGLCVSGI